MGKKNDQRKSKSKGARKGNTGKAEIKRAEQRLARALAGVDTAREKVSRRERDLAMLMTRHGRSPEPDTSTDTAIPLAAPAQIASENGAAQVAAEADDEGSVSQHDRAERENAVDDAGHHG